MHEGDLAFVLSALGARSITRTTREKALWAGYGEIVRVRATKDDGSETTAVVKHVRIPAGRPGDDPSRERKRRSYEVETAFYRELAPRTDASCPVARLIAVRDRVKDGERVIVLEDLDAAGFPGRAARENAQSLGPAIDWLAAFHASFFDVPRAAVWSVGTYWHLATRRPELALVVDAPLRESAEWLDAALRRAEHQTLVHGDAKLANFCFSERGDRAAAVDFQYTGGGPGVVDVAYLLYAACDDGTERALLDRYFTQLGVGLVARAHDPARIADVVREWRALYPIALADFARFLAGWAPEAFAGDGRTRERVLRIVRDVRDVREATARG